MKEIKYVKLDIVEKELHIPYIPLFPIKFEDFDKLSAPSIISLIFEKNIPYTFDLKIDFINNPNDQYEVKIKSYDEPVYLNKEIVDKYFMSEKEFHNFKFNLKMDKLLE